MTGPNQAEDRLWPSLGLRGSLDTEITDTTTPPAPSAIPASYPDNWMDPRPRRGPRSARELPRGWRIPRSEMNMVKPSDAGECQSLSISSRCCKLSPRISILATWPVECLVFLRLQQLCRLTQLLHRCRKQTRNQHTFCVVNYCTVKNNLQSPVGQLKTQRGNLMIPSVA